VAREAGDKRIILFNLSGHGHFDLSAYEAYMSGELEDVETIPLKTGAIVQQMMTV